MTPRHRLGARLRSAWDALRASFWFVPASLLLGSAVLAFVMVRIDVAVARSPFDALPWIRISSADGARAILSVLAGSMITVTGVVFSITVVALTLATSQYGPRLMRGFLRDRGNQVVLGVFLATFLYSLLVLQSVDGVEEGFIPHFAVLLAMLLGVASLSVLVYFIHHMATSMQASSIVESAAHELRANVERLYPEELGEEREGVPVEGPSGEPQRLLARVGGYLRVIDEEALLRAASEHDLVVRLEVRPGDFLVPGDPLLSVWCDGALGDEAADDVRSAFACGVNRTAVQDVRFCIDQLVEVAQRALSPGVNDPVTAIACIDRLGEGMTLLAGRRIPSAARRDEAGALRVIAPPVDFCEALRLAIHRIRRDGSGHGEVVAALLRALARVAARTRAAPQLLCVREALDALAESLQREIPLSVDREPLLEQCASLRAEIEKRAGAARLGSPR